MDDQVGLILFYVLMFAALGVVALIMMVLTILPIIIISFVIIFNFGIGREILTYEWDGAEKILWLALFLFLFPFGGLVYMALRRDQRELQIASLRKAQDPRVTHIPIYTKR